jgi:cyclic pyranopterin phosphate synthase
MEALLLLKSGGHRMCKALQKDMIIGPTLLVSKSGGKNGNYALEEE